MKLSFVIPAHNEAQYIGQCLDSILKTLRENHEEAEVLVINNASTDNTKDIAARYPGVRVVDEPEKGLTKARQKGLRAARGELLAYIDADTQVPPAWLGILKREFSRRKDLVCLSGPYKYYDLPKFQKFLAEFGWKIFAPPTYHAVGYMVLGGNFVAKKDALIKAGGFDANIKFYGEDTDIARRLSAVGKVLFLMEFFIYTSGRRLKGQGLFKIYITYAMNFLWQVIFHRTFTHEYKDIR
jgi:glycosyltransferase involved in cell wall biosynthesis